MRILKVSKVTVVEALAFSPDGQALAVGSTRADVRIWRVATGKSARTLPNTKSARTVFFSNDALFVSNHIRILHRWEDDTPQRFPEHSKGLPITSAISPDRSRIIRSYELRDTYQLDCVTADGELLWHRDGPNRRYPQAPTACFLLDGRVLLVTSEGVLVFPTDGVGSPTTLAMSADWTPAPSGTVACQPDGGLVAIRNRGTNEVTVIDVSAERVVTQFSADSRPLPRRATVPMAFSADGRWLAVGTQADGVRFWETATWKEASSFQPEVGPVHALTFSPDGTLAAAGGTEGRVALWDV